jgi:menaquinone-dependent protoporphyrinogen IX oxidase
VRSSASDVADSEPLSKVVAGAEWKRVDDVVLGTPVSRQAKYIDVLKFFLQKCFETSMRRSRAYIRNTRLRMLDHGS